jgi:hypothetical protein
MQIAKSKLEIILKDLPEIIDIDEVMYRLYLLEKVESGEKDIQNGNVLTHAAALERISRKWRS